MRFNHFGNQHVEFGGDTILKLPEIAGRIRDSSGIHSEEIVIMTGAKSFVQSEKYTALITAMNRAGFNQILSVSAPGEPSPGMIDLVVDEAADRFGRESCRKKEIIVISIGGGSALDAGKALAAMLPLVPETGPLPAVKDYLEGVGKRKPGGWTVPFIACPTTAGTGSEATKNAVISEIGDGGFKKSLRHDNYLPLAAVIDPVLAINCPRSVTAASGLDALTQLIEAWTSPLLTPFMSGLIPGAVKSFAESFLRALDNGGDLFAREGLAYSAYISGLALANCGLGSVHAMASAIGGRFPIAHGVICGTLIKNGAELNIRKINGLLKSSVDHEKETLTRSLNSYARAGFILSGQDEMDNPWILSESKLTRGTELLLETLEQFLQTAKLPSLKSSGFDEESIPGLAASCQAKSNPVPLAAEDYEYMLRRTIQEA